MNNKLLNKDSVIAIVLMLFSVYIIHYSLNLSGLAEAIDMITPGLVPAMVGVLLFICSLVLLFQTIQSSRKTQINHETSNVNTSLSEGIESFAFKRLVVVIAAIIVYRYLLVLFGFYITSFMFLVVLFLFLKSVKLHQAFVISLFTVGIVGYLFGIVLRVPFPHGILIPYF